MIYGRLFLEAMTSNVKGYDINDIEVKDYITNDSYMKKYKDYLSSNTGEVLIDTIKNKVVGYVFVGDKKDKGFISTLEVKKEYRGKGYGKKLLKDAISRYKAIDLVVMKDNKIAYELYKKNNFIIIDEISRGGRPAYYMKLKSKLTKDERESVIKESGISGYKRVIITKDSIDKYKTQYKSLSHLRVNNNTNGIILVDENDTVVGVINTEKKDDGIWIQGFEIFGKYKGKGLSEYFLDIAVKKFHATKLAVSRRNETAMHIYKKYGFKIYDEFTNGYFMKL